jgi:hypothetical protein
MARHHHTISVLREAYVPQGAAEIELFAEMQIFMYAVMVEHLKTDKGRSVVRQFESTSDAQSIYCELKRHALSSTAAMLAGDSLMQYLVSAKFPGKWKGTSFGFVLHWKEQVPKYESLDLEEMPAAQKLRML